MKILYLIITCMIPFPILAMGGTYSKIIYNYTYRDINKTLELYYNNESSISLYSQIGLDNYVIESDNYSFNDSSISLYMSGYDYIGEMVYRNFIAQELKIRIPESRPFNSFNVNDIWNNIDWIIFENEYKSVLGYTCNKAVGQFRGRTYTVWFTRSIPYTVGPWKLFGLEGAILEAIDESGQFNFEAIIIDTLNNHNLKFVQEVETKTIEEYADFLDYFHIKIAEKFGEKLKESGLNVRNPKSRFTKDELRNRNIEKKYEWE